MRLLLEKVGEYSRRFCRAFVLILSTNGIGIFVLNFVLILNSKKFNNPKVHKPTVDGQNPGISGK